MRDQPDINAAITRLRAKYARVIVILSPPRCSSTALARVFWEHPRVRYYAHEPFESTYYRGDPLSAALAAIDVPLDLIQLNSTPETMSGNCLVIKEMPYQVGAHFPLLAALATHPIIFNLRDPRLNIASRMAKKAETGDSPFFPLVESGWQLLFDQIAWCRANGSDYRIVDASTYRNWPERIFPELFAAQGLEFDVTMLQWEAAGADISLDNLAGDHAHLYRRVLRSGGLQPAHEPIPPVATFPETGDLRRHVSYCLTLYAQLRADPHFISPWETPA